jgi:hypothetical protein
MQLNLELKFCFFFVEWIVKGSNSNNFIKVIMVALMKRWAINYKRIEPYGETLGSQINPSSNGQLIFFGCGVLPGAHSVVTLANHQ